MEPQEGKKRNTTGKRENSYSADVYTPAKRHRKDRQVQNRHHRHERSEGRNSLAGFEDNQISGRTERSNSWSAYVDNQASTNTKRRDNWSFGEDSHTLKRRDSCPSIKNNHSNMNTETDDNWSTRQDKQSPRNTERHGSLSVSKDKQSPRSSEIHGSWSASKDGQSLRRSERGDSWSSSKDKHTRRSPSKRGSRSSSKDKHTRRSSGGRDSWSSRTDIQPPRRTERRHQNWSDNKWNPTSRRTSKRSSWPTSKDNQTPRRYDTANDTEFEFFWKSHSPYSQWYLSNFTVDGITFNCTEQYMMYSKAILFKDKETAYEILEEHEPREHKKLGRKVKNFDQHTWDDNCMDIVICGNKAKFEQNKDLMRTILKTFPKTLAEASPFDRIWGIGLSADDPRALNKETWKGKNLLGHALTKIRDRFIEREKGKQQKKRTDEKHRNRKNKEEERE
ncbi:unnamed protein product [Mytilus coruscus]|uniref:NADAR domain-containing protein n=1 Tax=Mytilus coruscus TaxID=42192 RepID=A0A6J8EIR4_MYTCO|nr:unnamed protein product [Mytilus coruscus]